MENFQTRTDVRQEAAAADPGGQGAVLALLDLPLSRT